MKLTTPTESDVPAKPRRRLQRRPGPHPIQDALNGILLEDEESDDLKAHCQSLVQKIAPKCEYDQFLAQLSASNTWRARRFVIYEGALVAGKVLDQAPQVDREYEILDSHSRASLTLSDQEFLKTLRYVRDTETTCLRRANILNREMRIPPSK